jgi:tetratricopeptide (TPR) repeat protein
MAFNLLLIKEQHSRRVLFFIGGRMPLETSVFGQVESDLKNKKYNLALQRLLQISVQYSKSPTYLIYLAQVLRGMGDQTALIKTLTELNKLQPSRDIEIELMSLLYKNGQINESLDIGLSLGDKTVTAKQKLAIDHILLKIYIEENDFEGVQELIDHNQDFLMHDDFFIWAQGLVYLSRQNRYKALQFFRKSLQLNNQNDQAWVSLALIHHEMADDELALANLEKALDCNPMNNVAVKLYSTWSAQKSENDQKALSSIQFYLSENEFDEEISLCHVELLSRLEKWNEAQYEINRLILTHPRNINYPEVKKNLVQNLNM